MGNKESNHLTASSIKTTLRNTLHIPSPKTSKPSNSFKKSSKRSKKRRVRACKCALYLQTKTHCCYQCCLRDSDYSNLTKVWLFTEEHSTHLQEVLTAINLQDITEIIEEFLSGINSTLEEYSVFCHGSLDNNSHYDNPCKIWLKSKTTRPIHMEILGSNNVGKSALAEKCVNDIYHNDSHNDNHYNSMNGCGNMHQLQSVYIKALTFQKTTVKLRIFDAQSDARSGFNPTDYQTNDSDSIYLLCVDPSSDRYWEELRFIQQQRSDILQQYNVTNSSHDAVRSAFIVVATKCDLKNQQYIGRSEEVIRYCKSNNTPYIEVSAKRGINLDFFLKKCVYELWIQTQTHCSS